MNPRAKIASISYNDIFSISKRRCFWYIRSFRASISSFLYYSERGVCSIRFFSAVLVNFFIIVGEPGTC